MSVEKLLAALRKEADLKESAVLQEAEDKARTILSGAREKAREIHSQVSTLEKALEAKREALLLSQKKMRVRKTASENQNRIISRIFEECSVLYRRFMDSPAYSGFLKDECQRIREEMGTVEEIRADPVTAKILKDLGHSHIVIREEIENGFVAVTEKGALKISCVFDLRLRKVWNEVAPRFVARIAESEPLKH